MEKIELSENQLKSRRNRNVALGIVLALLVVGFYAMTRADLNSLERQRVLFSNGLTEQVAAVAREQESVTVWDDSVVQAKAGNSQWLYDSEKIRAYLQGRFGAA